MFDTLSVCADTRRTNRVRRWAPTPGRPRRPAGNQRDSDRICTHHNVANERAVMNQVSQLPCDSDDCMSATDQLGRDPAAGV